MFEGGADFGLVGSEDAEGGLVPDDSPVGMSVQEMVMSTTEEDTVGGAGLTTVLPIFHVVGFAPSHRDLASGPPQCLSRFMIARRIARGNVRLVEIGRASCRERVYSSV